MGAGRTAPSVPHRLNFIHMKKLLLCEISTTVKSILQILYNETNLYFLSKMLLHLYIYLIIVSVYMCAKLYSWRSEDNFLELILPFHHAGTRDCTPVTGVGDKHLNPQNPWSHHTGPLSVFFVTPDLMTFMLWTPAASICIPVRTKEHHEEWRVNLTRPLTGFSL